jgi:hypothetical protein
MYLRVRSAPGCTRIDQKTHKTTAPELVFVFVTAGKKSRTDWLPLIGAAIAALEAAQVTVRSPAEWRSKYFHLAMRRGRKIAKVAMARKLAVRLYWMMCKQWDYEQVKKFGSHARQPGNRYGVKLNIELLIGYQAPLHGEFEVGIMIESVTEEMHGSD